MAFAGSVALQQGEEGVSLDLLKPPPRNETIEIVRRRAGIAAAVLLVELSVVAVLALTVLPEVVGLGLFLAVCSFSALLFRNLILGGQGALRGVVWGSVALIGFVFVDAYDGVFDSGFIFLMFSVFIAFSLLQAAYGLWRNLGEVDEEDLVGVYRASKDFPEIKAYAEHVASGGRNWLIGLELSAIYSWVETQYEVEEDELEEDLGAVRRKLFGRCDGEG